jgi:tight adherence protein C
LHIWFKFSALVVATVIILADVVLFVICRKETYAKTGLKSFLLEDLFFIGDKVSRMLHRGSNGKRVRKLEELYEGAFAGQIAKSAAVAPYTYFLLLAPLVLLVLAVSESRLAALMLAVLVGGLMVYFDIQLDSSLSQRHQRILREFATVLSKMSLLVNAGITATDAFERVAKSNDGILYKEMQRAAAEVENGRSISDALDEFAFRCGCKEVRKFVSLYKQNLVKGGPEFPILLQDMADTAWEERKARARLLGAAAEQKLLVPIMLMFIGVLIMVIVPAFNNLL